MLRTPYVTSESEAPADLCALTNSSVFAAASPETAETLNQQIYSCTTVNTGLKKRWFSPTTPVSNVVLSVTVYQLISGCRLEGTG